MKIRVNSHNVEIIREQTEPINEKEIKVSKCEFEFDDKITNDFVKEAYFTLNGETYKQIIQNNECEYPSEVLDKKGTLEIGVVAYKVENEQEIQRYNPSPDYFESWVGSLKDAENTEPITPTDKEQMEQALQNGLNDINDKIDEVDEKLDGIDTAIEETNNLNLDVSNKVDGDVTVTLTKKDASTKSVVLSDGTSLEFNWDGTKLGVKTSDEEEYTYVDLQGIQGPAGPQGEAFRIKKTYSSVAEMNADFNNMEYGDYVMIASSVEVEDNAKLYTRGESQWIFITDFSGATGIRGPVGATPNIQIGSVTSGSAPSVTRTGTDENPILNFVLQKGDKGDKGNTGNTGNGISSITKTGTSGLVDTYTITFTNGNTTTFDVSNGNGIDRIEKTATVGNIDTYTIYFTNGSTTTYEVANGEVTREELEEEVDRLSMIYNAFPSTSNEAEEMTLNGTTEVPFKKLNLKGNTSQNTTTGKNLVDFNNLINSSNTTHTWENNILIVSNTTGMYNRAYINITDIVKNNPNEVLRLDYTSLDFSKGHDSSIHLEITNNGTTSYTSLINNNEQNIPYNIPSDTTGITLVNLRFVSNNTGTSQSGEITINQPILHFGAEKIPYEEYTGGNPSPNPDYPQDIQVVSGNNSIKVEGKNLIGTLNQGGINLGSGGTDTGATNRVRTNFIEVDVNSQYRISNFGSIANQFGLGFYDENNNLISAYVNGGWSDFPATITMVQNTKYIKVMFRNTSNVDITPDLDYKIQIEKGNTSTEYEPYASQTYPINLESTELCKIGDYQDKIIKSTGKNLFDKDNANLISNRFINFDSHAYQYKSDGSNNRSYVVVLNIEPNTTYTISKILTSRFAVGTSQNEPQPDDYFNVGSQQNNATSITIKSGANDHYLTIWFIRTDIDTSLTIQQVLDSMMVEKNTSATPYEPYGKVWYLNKQIGKVVLDGSETIERISTQLSGYYRFAVSSPTDLKKHSIIDTRAGLLMSDKFIEISNKESNEQQVNGILVRANDSYNFVITCDETSSYTVSEFRPWLQNNNILVYYALATPTTTEITDTTLIEQLDNLENAYSYDTQTNISQTNNDIPFILDVEAILSLKNILEI